MKVFDHDTGQVVEIGDDQLTDALKSGRYTAPKGAAIPVVNTNTGEAASIAAEDAHRLLSEESFRIETAAEREERKTQEKYGDGLGAEATAFGLGVLRGGTVGVSDLIARGVGGPEVAKAIAEYRDRNPSATLGGEIVGSVAPAVLSAGAGAAGTAARLTPAGAVARLGFGAEHAAAGILGRGATSMAGQIVQKIIPMAAGSAVEGAIYGAGQSISEAALGDHELTAESLLANAGLGAVLGGASGGAVGLGGLVAKGAVKAASSGARATKEAVEKLYERATGNKAAEGLGKMWAKLSGIASGADDEVLEELFAAGNKGIERRARAIKSDSVLDDAAESLRKAYDDILANGKVITPEALGNSKLQRYGEVIKKGNESLVYESARSLVDEVGGQVDTMIEAGRGFSSVAGLPRMRDVVEAYGARIDGIAKSGADDINARIFLELDNLKRDVGSEVRKLRGVTTKDRAWRETYDALRDTEGGLYNQLKLHLENELLYGDAAGIQRAVNEKWAKHLGPENYRNNFAVQMGSDNFDDIYVANDAKFRSFVRDLRSVDSNDYKYISHHVQTKRELVEEIEKHYDLAPEVKDSVKKFREAAESFEKTLGSTKEDVIAINQLKELEQMNSSKVLGALGGAGIGYVVGDEEGAVLGAGVGALMRPGQTIRQLAMMERIYQRTAAKLTAAGRGVARIGRGAGLAGRETAEAAVSLDLTDRLKRAVAPATVKTVSFLEKRKEQRRDGVTGRAGAYLDRLDELSQLSTNPALLSERLTAALLPVDDVAPRTARAMADRMQAAVQFLHAKAPKPPPSVTESLTPKTWRPTDGEISRWERYLKAVEDPMSAIDSFERGNMNREQVETLKAVYPKIYGQMVQEVQTNLGELQRDLPYAKRVQLSIFFGVPIDASMTAAFISTVQNMHAAEEAAAAANNAPRPRGKPSKIPDSHQTGSQRVEAR